ncbi:hypothetical protein L3X38_026200 [Prunus dulcis]|uniref:Glabrous enhancer-binding protein-like DBD domain-containing protein n=1 Tax=Prunus dulcis TaxID=3755 RepID=A0AAD4Z841_PRUDU|nr:hypothetical protein L3X38_026200 [Prunus dulcis]
MAFSQSSSSSYESYSSSSSFDEDHQSDSYDDELEDEQLAPDSQESPTLVGSDTEYRCESEPDSEADSAKKTMTKTKTKTNTNVEAKSKNTSPSSTAVANEKRPREKPEEKGGDASNKKRKAENETNLQTGGDDAVKDKEMMKKKKKKSRSSSSTAGNARVWSERDELVMVKGIISFLKKFSTFDGKKFYNWINKYIEADVSTGQIADKVCRLKKKYRNNEANRRPNGEDPVFSKPHEQKLFDLSKQAWGSIRSTTNNNTNADINDGIVEKGADAQKKATDVVDDAQKKVTDVVDDAEKKATGVVDDDVLQEKEVLFDDNLVMEAFDKYLTSRGLDLRWFGRDKLESLENKWRKIRVAESTFRLLQAKFDVKLHQIALHACNFFDY